MRKYIAESAPAIPLIRNSWDHPLVQREWLGKTSDNMFRLWEERGNFMDCLNHLPQTICHLDVFRRNLFARKMPDDGDQTLVLDWAYVGQGAIGEELSPLVLVSFAFYEVDLDQVKVL